MSRQGAAPQRKRGPLDPVFVRRFSCHAPRKLCPPAKNNGSGKRNRANRTAGEKNGRGRFSSLGNLGLHRALWLSGRVRSVGRVGGVRGIRRVRIVGGVRIARVLGLARIARVLGLIGVVGRIGRIGRVRILRLIRIVGVETRHVGALEIHLQHERAIACDGTGENVGGILVKDVARTIRRLVLLGDRDRGVGRTEALVLLVRFGRIGAVLLVVELDRIGRVVIRRCRPCTSPGCLRRARIGRSPDATSGWRCLRPACCRRPRDSKS